MPYDDVDPDADTFTLELDDLVLTRVQVDDAAEVFALLTDARLTFIAEDRRPKSVEQLVHDIEQSNAGAENGPHRRRYQWLARRRDTRVAVAVVVADLDYYEELVPVRDDDGHIVDLPTVEVRVAEATVYVHPDHQEEKGSYWGSKSAQLVWRFAGEHFGCTVRRAKIELVNHKSIRRAEQSGMRLVRSGTRAGVPEGYGIWEGPLT